jgi:hypothetical protein
MAKTINRIIGGETGGLQEANTAGGTWSVSSANTSLLNNDSYHFRVTGSGSSANLIFFWYDAVAHAGDGLILSFDVEFTAWPTGTGGFCVTRAQANLDPAISLEVSPGGVVDLTDAGGVTLDSTAALSLNTKYRFEVYFENTASADWEWWLSTSDGTPVSQGSGTGADFSTASIVEFQTRFRGDSDGTLAFDVNNIVLQSGCTSSDTLGEAVEVLCLSTPLGSPTTGGDTLDSGAMTNTQEIPASGSFANFVNPTSAKSRWIQSDGNRYIYYYFDASDEGPTDAQSVWMGDEDAFDGDLNTDCGGSIAGTDSNNALSGGGTTAPTSSSYTIVSVKARYLGNPGNASNDLRAAIYTDGKSELLGTITATGSGEVWTAYTTLSTPTGGWTWAKIAALEVYLFLQAYSSGVATVSYVEVAVETSSIRTPGDYGATNTVAAKVAWVGGTD